MIIDVVFKKNTSDCTDVTGKNTHTHTVPTNSLMSQHTHVNTPNGRLFSRFDPEFTQKLFRSLFCSTSKMIS